MTEIHYEMREKDLVAFHEHRLESLEHIQKVVRRHQAILPGIIAVTALVLFFYFKDIPSAIYAVLLSIAWGVGVPLYLKWNMRKQILQSFTDKEKASIMGNYTLKTEQSGLVEIKEGGEPNKLPWKNVLRVEVEKDYLFVYVSLKEALTIPRKTLTKDSKLAEFVRTVDEFIEKAG